MRLLIFTLLLASVVRAQSFQGSLRGRVVDPNDAAVPAARLTITDEATKVSRSTLTNDAGEYVFTAVTPATYSVTAEAEGFKRLERPGVAVSTQTAATLDLKLELGQVSEQVNVTGDPPTLQTADASTGQLLDRQKITDLPLLGRNPFFTGKLAQAVVFVNNPKFARMQDQNGNSQVSIAGGPLRTNNYLVDGISIADSNNRAVILPSPEAVQELKVQAATYDAEVSRTGGGTFNTLLRSGSNDLHGSAVGHIRETGWLANSFFANRAGQPVPDQPFRDWAGSLGGPLLIPKLYNGRNKTFFFVSTEAYRQRDGNTTVLAVPTPLERAGNFSQTFQKNGTQQVIYDPLSTSSTGARQPFAGNVIPASAINPIGRALASFYPNPNAPTPYYQAPNYNFTGSFPNRGDQYTAKADHQFASWLQASGSYIHQKTFEVDYPTNIFPNVASPNQTLCCDRKIDATQANATISPDATTVIAVRWGFNRFYSRTTQESAGFNVAALGLPAGLAALTPDPAFPSITMGGAVNGCGAGTTNDYSNFGGGCANQDVFYSRSFNTTATKFLGRHSVKAGFDFRAIHDFGTPATGPTSLGFTDVFTRATPQVSTQGTGSSLATLLLGYPTSGQMTLVTSFNDYVHYYGGFVQDDFRISPKLTLNLGLRLEHESGIQEANNRLITGFNPTVTSPLQAGVTGLQVRGGVQYAGVGGAPAETGNPLGVKPGPRIGLAYSADGKTVIRAGYGIFWVPTFFNFQNAIGYSQSTSIVASTNGNFTPAASLNNPYPSGLLQPTGNSLGLLSGIGQAITVYDPNAGSAGYVQQYSFEVQRQGPAGFVITAGGVGSHSLHLLRNGQNIDQLNPSYYPLASALTQSVPNPFYGNGGVGTVGTANVNRLQLLLPFPQYTSVALSNSDTAAARYYSFYVRGERRFRNGLGLLASYTWSRSNDNVTGSSTAGASQVAALAGPQNAYNLNGEWSLSTQDAPNRFTTALTYELPFGHGRPLLQSNRVLNYVAGGWSFNAFGVIQSGYPLSVTQPNNNSVLGTSYQRPNATGISTATPGSTDDRITGWLNPAAFSQAPQFTFGNTGRFLDVRGPGLFNWDLSLAKAMVIRERIKAQFRFEALNATNTVYFGNPNTTFTSSSFGQITSQINNPRLVQLGIRATF
ncbi:MAG: carboxypeptidase regulatory-like domain-containing protein [Acidobacteriia bacterium]|nr:carboxypeptidase regulatory-like domain-containing protein [Terriglobia bacterium]